MVDRDARWGCEYCDSEGPCNCEAIIAQQDAEAAEAEAEETSEEDV